MATLSIQSAVAMMLFWELWQVAGRTSAGRPLGLWQGGAAACRGRGTNRQWQHRIAASGSAAMGSRDRWCARPGNMCVELQRAVFRPVQVLKYGRRYNINMKESGHACGTLMHARDARWGLGLGLGPGPPRLGLGAARCCDFNRLRQTGRDSPSSGLALSLARVVVCAVASFEISSLR